MFETLRKHSTDLDLITPYACWPMHSQYPFQDRHNYLNKSTLKLTLPWFSGHSTRLMKSINNLIEKNNVAFCEMVACSACDSTSWCRSGNLKNLTTFIEAYTGYRSGATLTEIMKLNQSNNGILHVKILDYQ